MSSFSSSFPTNHSGNTRFQGQMASGPAYGSTSSQTAPRLLNGQGSDQQHNAAGGQQASSHQVPPRFESETAPHTQSCHHRDALTRTAAPIDEASDEDATSRSQRDCDSANDSQQSSSLFSSPRRNCTRQAANSNRAPQASKISRVCIRWSPAEDQLLMSSVQKQGPDWDKIIDIFEKAGGPARGYHGITQHYQKLIKQEEEQREAAAAAAKKKSSTPQQTQKRKRFSTTQTTSPPAANRSWTSEEDKKLADIAKVVERRRVFAEWRKVFPNTMRSDYAVLARYDIMMRETREKDADAAQEELIDEDSQQAAGATASGSKGLEMSPTNQLRRAKSSANGVSPFGRSASSSSRQSGQRYGSSSHQSNGTAHTQPARLSRVVASPFPSSAGVAGEVEVIHPQSQSTTPLLLPITDYTVTCHSAGVLVQDFPPLHHLLILAPGVCRVIVPSPQVLQAASRGELGNQQLLTAQQLSAPFVFKVTVSGSIQGLVLPPATTTSISIQDGHEPDEQSGEVEERQARSYVETAFQCEDGWNVVFRTAQSNL